MFKKIVLDKINQHTSQDSKPTTTKKCVQAPGL